jgi:hypothetical protein
VCELWCVWQGGEVANRCVCGDRVYDIRMITQGGEGVVKRCSVYGMYFLHIVTFACLLYSLCHMCA